MSCLCEAENDVEFKDCDLRRDSDEDTEDASETEAEKKEEEFTGIKEQIYHDQLKQFHRQLQQLKDGSLPIYLKKLKRLEQQYQDRMLMNDILTSFQMNLFEQEYFREKEHVNKEFEEKKSEMQENLVRELEHKKKLIEAERHVMELTGDTTCVKPVTTRKLRRRPNDPPPLPEKRNKPSPVQLSLSLSEQDSNEDLARLSRLSKVPGLDATGGGGGSGGMIMASGFGVPSSASTSSSSSFNVPSSSSISSFCPSLHEAFVEEGRLFLDKRWFSKEQSVLVDSKEHSKFNAYISSIHHDEITVKRVSDNTKLKITLTSLQRAFQTASFKFFLGHVNK